MSEPDLKFYYSRYAPMIFRKCLLILNNEEMALCAMRDVFVDFLEDRNRFDIEYPSEEFYRTAERICRKYTP